MKKWKKQDNSKLLILLLLITLIAVSVTVWALFFRDSGPTLAPDYTTRITEGSDVLLYQEHVIEADRRTTK